jgi:hypothetical protein
MPLQQIENKQCVKRAARTAACMGVWAAASVDGGAQRSNQLPQLIALVNLCSANEKKSDYEVGLV